MPAIRRSFLNQGQAESRFARSSAEVEEQATREAILSGVRPDGRGFKDIRPITCQVGVLPARSRLIHFQPRRKPRPCARSPSAPAPTRQMVDGLIEEYGQKFMLHYNFPSYSVGEVRPIRARAGVKSATVPWPNGL